MWQAELQPAGEHIAKEMSYRGLLSSRTHGNILNVMKKGNCCAKQWRNGLLK